MFFAVVEGSNPVVPNAWEFAVWGVALLALAVVLVALIGIARSHQLSSAARAVWVLIVLAFPLLGPVLWFVIGRPTKGSADRDIARNEAPKTENGYVR